MRWMGVGAMALLWLAVLAAIGGEKGIIFWSIFVGLAALALQIDALKGKLLPKPDAAGAYGTARFQSPEETAERFRHEGYIIGRNPATGEICRLQTERHMLTVAPSRTGKGVGTVIPNLLLHLGSVVCIDVKGENAVITARRRGELGEVVVLDPFKLTGLGCGVFNPLRRLSADDENLRDDAAAIAEMIIPGKPAGQLQDWWISGARTLLAGIIMHVVATPGETADLGRVRDLLTLDLGPTLDAMKNSPFSVIQKAAADYLERSEEGRNDVLSTARENTEFLDGPGIRRVVDGPSSFQAADLKKRVISVFLVLPPHRLATYDRWMRLVIGVTVLGVTESIAKPKNPVLFMLDEFAQLGYLRPIREAIGLMAGYGLCVWPIAQDLNQLYEIYGKTWETFIAASGAVQYFNTADQMTAGYVSKTLGQQTVEIRTAGQSRGESSRGGSSGENTGENVNTGFVGTPLLRPEQLVSEVPRDRMIVTVQGERPAMLSKVVYYDDPAFEGLWDVDWRKEETAALTDARVRL